MNIPERTHRKGTSRHRIGRIRALQALYEIDATGHPVIEIKNRYDGDHVDAYINEYVQALVEGCIKHITEIDKMISTFATQWPINQVSMVDRNILRLAVFELLIGRQAPPKVVANEAVELSKVFGSENSPTFVNGVLGSIIANSGPTGEDNIQTNHG